MKKYFSLVIVFVIAILLVRCVTEKLGDEEKSINNLFLTIRQLHMHL